MKCHAIKWGHPVTFFASEGEGKAGLICPSGVDVSALLGDIRSHQDVLTVPREIIELNLTAVQQGCAGGGGE